MKPGQDLYEANLQLQRRSRILAREERILVCRRLLAYTSATEYVEKLDAEIARLEGEIALEGPDPA